MRSICKKWLDQQQLVGIGLQVKVHSVWRVQG
jgi:hypothetical protein